MDSIQPKKFKFWFNIRGVETHEILNAPKDWDKMVVAYERHKTYRGTLKNLTLPFSFILKGAGLLRREFFTYGMKAAVKFLIDKNNPATYKYENIYKGKFDFSQFEDGTTDAGATSTSDDISIKVGANDNISYQIPLNVPEAVEVLLTPIQLKEKADFIFIPSQTDQQPGYAAVQVVNYQQAALLSSVQDVGYQTRPAPDFANDQTWFFNAQTDTTLRVDIIDLIGSVQLLGFSGPNRFRLQIVKNDGTVLANVYDITINFVGVTPYNITTSYIFNVNKGDKLFLYERLDGDTSSSTGFNVNEGQLTLSYKTETAASKCKGLRLSYIFNELLQLMNGKNTGGVYVPTPTMSALLESTLKNVVITCSNSIRQIVSDIQHNPGDQLSPGSTYLVVNGRITYNLETIEPGVSFVAVDDALTFTTDADGSVLLTNVYEFLSYKFTDYFQTILALMAGNAAYGIDNGINRLEDLAFVYRNNLQILDVGGDHREYKLVPAVDQLYNSIKVGYETQQYDALNGIQEVNATQIYSANIDFVKKELNLISPTRADAFGIEQVRVTPADTAASRSDNDNFLIWLKDEPEAGETYYQPLRGEGLISISGVDAGETYYNWMLTPKRNLLRGGSYLASIFYNLAGYKIHFENADKNFNFTTVGLDGKRVSEKEDIEISNLPNPVFIPYNVSFLTDLPYNAMNFIEGRGYGAISLKVRGYPLKGFIEGISTDIAQNSTREYKLLLTPDNNLLNLIE